MVFTDVCDLWHELRREEQTVHAITAFKVAAIQQRGGSLLEVIDHIYTADEISELREKEADHKELVEETKVLSMFEAHRKALERKEKNV